MQCSQPFRSLVALSQVRYPLAARLQRGSSRSVWNGAVGWLLVGWLVGLGVSFIQVHPHGPLVPPRTWRSCVTP